MGIKNQKMSSYKLEYWFSSDGNQEGLSDIWLDRFFAPKNITTEKQKYFHECLIKKGIAMYLEKADINKLKMINYTPLNESNKIAKEIKKRFLN